jgi:hypothetical protein
MRTTLLGCGLFDNLPTIYGIGPGLPTGVCFVRCRDAKASMAKKWGQKNGKKGGVDRLVSVDSHVTLVGESV